MITIKQSPQLISPVRNPIVFTVDSTNKAKCNFQYLAGIYVNGVYVTTLELFPTGVNGYASFKIARLLQDYLSYDKLPNLFGTSGNPNSIINFQVKFGESYDTSIDCTAGPTQFPDLTVTGTLYAFNGALQYDEWPTYDYNTFIMNGPTKKFLTNMPNNALIGLEDQLNINFFNMTTATISSIEVNTYNEAGTLINTYRFANNNYTLSTLQDRLVSAGIGPYNLNNTTLTLGSQPVIDEDVYTYTVTLLDGSNLPLSETKTFELDKRISNYPGRRLWFMNQYGAFDAYTYSLKDTSTINISRTEYDRLYGQYETSSPNNLWTYDIGDRGKTNLSITAQEVYTFNSNWLTEAEGLWQKELFYSLEVYLTKNVPCPTVYTFSFDSLNCYIGPGHDPENFLQFNVTSLPPGFQIGDSIFVAFDQPSLIDGYYEVINYSIDVETNIYTITIDYPCDSGYETQTGTITYNTAITYTNSLTPVIVKETSFEPKYKRNVKNVAYTLSVQPAYEINVQRN